MRIRLFDRRRWTAVAVGAVLALLIAAAALAAPRDAPRPGTPDRSFSGDGVVTRDFGSEPGLGGAKQVIAEPDGTALVLSERHSIGHFLGNGTLDPAFGEAGYIAVDYFEASTMARAGDGRIIVAGFLRAREGAPGQFVVRRYNGDGSLDRSFGDGGSVLAPAADGFESPNGAFVEADGKILLLGRVVEDDYSAVEAIRLLPGGGFDPTYGEQGHTRIRLPGTAYAEYVNSPLTDFAMADGKLTIGLSSAGGPDDLLVRIGADGRPDRTLGGDGIVSFRTLDGALSGLAIAGDGRIVVSGESGLVARFMPDGSVDPAFGQGGRADTAIPGDPRITAAAIEPDGRIVLAGGTHDESNQPKGFLVARLTSAGALDPSFGAGRGYAEADLDPTAGDEAAAIAELPGGGLLLAGTSPLPVPVYVPRLALARFSPDGMLDPAFGDNGLLLTHPRVQATDSISAAVRQPHGAVAVAGAAAGQVLLARYLADGRPDPGFGAGGFVTATTRPSNFGETATSLAAYPGERLLVGAASRPGSALLMYRADGTPDSGFGGDGRVDVAGFDDLLDFAVDGDGAILAVGLSYGPCAASVVRLRPDGSPDQSFGSSDGVAPLGPFSGACAREAVHLLQRPDGRIIVGGTQGVSFFRELTSDGALIKGRRGARRRYRDRPEKLVTMSLDPRGRLLVGGKERTGELAITRYTTNGFPDPSFGRGGVVKLKFGLAAQAQALRPMPSGAVFVAAAIRECNGPACEGTNPAVLRLTPDGKLDRRFGRKGVWTRRVGTAAWPVTLTLGPDSLTISGSANRPGTGRDLFIARLHR
jgi:uncharacterized delta-60 repeat protein